MYKWPIFIGVILIVPALVVTLLAVKDYRTTIGKMDLINRMSCEMLLDNFQLDDGISIHTSGSAMSPNYNNYLNFLSSNGLDTLSDEMRFGYDYNMTAANFQMAYLDETILEQQYLDLINNTVVNMEIDGVRIGDYIEIDGVNVTVNGPSLMSLADTSLEVYGDSNRLLDMYGSGVSSVVDYVVDFEIDYTVKQRNLLFVEFAGQYTNNRSLEVPAVSVATRHYNMFN